MRTGLDKPGALPLLALVIFSLLTLVPSLSSIYNLKLADFSFYTGATRQVHLLQDGVTEVPKHPLTEHQPWALAPQRSRVNLLPRTARNGASIPASETTAVANKSRFSSRESSSFTRRARAFRTYFIRQLDVYPFLPSFSNHSIVEHSYPTTLNQTLPTSTQSYNHTDQEPGQQSAIHYMCQQVWHLAIDIGKRATSRGSEETPISAAETQTPTLIQHSTISNSSELASEKPAQTFAEDSSDAAAGRHSRELHGSCMAVVIGLVAGIMWF